MYPMLLEKSSDVLSLQNQGWLLPNSQARMGILTYLKEAETYHGSHGSVIMPKAVSTGSEEPDLHTSLSTSALSP